MDWKDLNLGAASLAKVRKTFKIASADDVAKLAWGAPLLLKRVLNDKEIARVKAAGPFGGPQTYDSSRYALGARLGATSFVAKKDDGFVDLRDSLIEKLKLADTPRQRAEIETKLQRLYSRPS